MQNHFLDVLCKGWLSWLVWQFCKALYSIHKIRFEYGFIKVHCLFRGSRKINVIRNAWLVTRLLLLAKVKLCADILVEVFKSHCKALFEAHLQDGLQVFDLLETDLRVYDRVVVL